MGANSVGFQMAGQDHAKPVSLKLRIQARKLGEKGKVVGFDEPPNPILLSPPNCTDDRERFIDLEAKSSLVSHWAD